MIIVAFYTNKVQNHQAHLLTLVLVVKVIVQEAVHLVLVTHFNVVNVTVVKVADFPMKVSLLLQMVHSVTSIAPEVVLNQVLAMHSNVVNVIVVTAAVSHMVVVSIAVSQLVKLVLVTHFNVVNVIVVIHADFLMKLVEMHLLHSQVDQNHVSTSKRVPVNEVIHANILTS